MTDERMEMLLKESFVNIRPGAELQEKLLQRLYAQMCIRDRPSAAAMRESRKSSKLWIRPRDVWMLM